MKNFNYIFIGIISLLVFSLSWFLYIGSEEQYLYLEKHLMFNIIKRTLGASILGALLVFMLFIINYIKTKNISRASIISSYALSFVLFFSLLGTLLFFKNLIIN